MRSKKNISLSDTGGHTIGLYDIKWGESDDYLISKNEHEVVCMLWIRKVFGKHSVLMLCVMNECFHEREWMEYAYVCSRLSFLLLLGILLLKVLQQ